MLQQFVVCNNWFTVVLQALELLTDCPLTATIHCRSWTRLWGVQVKVKAIWWRSWDNSPIHS